MDNFYLFSTNEGKVLLDLREAATYILREGLKPDTMVVEHAGLEPVVVNMNFEYFVEMWYDHVNESVPVKKEPRPAKAKRGSVAPPVLVSSVHGPDAPPETSPSRPRR